MKVLVFFLPLLLLLAGCSQQPKDDWYDQSVQHNVDKDAYIDAMVDAGMDPKEAREMHDRKVWEMNTINLSRESGPRTDEP